MSDAAKICPVARCENSKGEDQVVCPHHWYQLPSQLRARVWRLFRTERGSAAHLQAIKESVQLLNLRAQAKGAIKTDDSDSREA